MQALACPLAIKTAPSPTARSKGKSSINPTELHRVSAALRTETPEDFSANRISPRITLAAPSPYTPEAP